MTYYADLSPCDYFEASWTDCLRAVGWLEGGHDYRRGNPSTPFVDKLTALLQEPWQPVWFLGGQPCGLCEPEITGYTNGLPTMSVGHIPSGGSNLFVPDDKLLYVAPELVKHYIDAHGYCPPEEFCAAVMRCPDMWSDEYFRAVSGTNWGKVFKEVLEADGQSWTEYVMEGQRIHGMTPEESQKFTETLNDDAPPTP
jgi:hypothetical protein